MMNQQFNTFSEIIESGKHTGMMIAEAIDRFPEDFTDIEGSSTIIQYAKDMYYTKYLGSWIIANTNVGRYKSDNPDNKYSNIGAKIQFTHVMSDGSHRSWTERCSSRCFTHINPVSIIQLMFAFRMCKLAEIGVFIDSIIFFAEDEHKPVMCDDYIETSHKEGTNFFLSGMMPKYTNYGVIGINRHSEQHTK